MAAVFLEVSVLLPEELRLEPGPAGLPGGCVLWHFMEHGLYQRGLL